jgi:DNA-binding MurR/RpiR family transcriptional regulator
MAPGDVLISTSCAPYTAQVAEVSLAAAEAGLRVIALTDSSHAPLIRRSEAAILVPHGSSFLSNSLTPFVMAAECLINGCAAVAPDAARRALAERDAMIRTLGVEM